MVRKLLFAMTIFVFGIGAAWAQLIELDPSELDPNATSAKDTKLVSTPAVPADEHRQFEQAVKDIHFDFDKAALRPEDKAILASDAEWLKAHTNVMITIEGDADERGDIVYNVVLSGERANAAKDALMEMGVPESQIAFATGWGKLYPVCTQSEEGCWSENRRAHFATWPPPEQEPTRIASR